MSWTLYIVLCTDGTLYTGITNDLVRRLAMHDAGRGARYTRGRGPVRLLYREACADRSQASRREVAVKRLPVAGKRALVAAARRVRPAHVRAVKASAPSPKPKPKARGKRAAEQTRGKRAAEKQIK